MASSEAQGVVRKGADYRYRSFQHELSILEAGMNPVHVARAERWVSAVNIDEIKWPEVYEMAFPRPSRAELRACRLALTRINCSQPIIAREPIVPINPRLWRSMYAEPGSVLFHLLHGKNRLESCCKILCQRHADAADSARFAQTFQIHELYVQKGLDQMRQIYELDSEIDTLQILILRMYGEVQTALDLD